MSELLGPEEKRVAGLLDYARSLVRGERSRSNFSKYESLLKSADPFEVDAVVDQLVVETKDMEALKNGIAMFIRAAGSGIASYPLPRYPEESLFARLIHENLILSELLKEISHHFKGFEEGDESPQKILEILGRTRSLLKEHYQKLQNQLFAELEKISNQHRCTELMWKIQEDVLEDAKELIDILQDFKKQDYFELNQRMGTFFLEAKSLIWREEHILFPVAYRFTAHTMTYQAPGSYDPSLHPDRSSPVITPDDTLDREVLDAEEIYAAETGRLNSLELEALFATLPVDITLIDKDNRVRFFSNTPDRVFHRHPAIIGREVNKCHPPKSVKAVEKIIEDLKSGKKDSESFWLHLEDKMVFIRYVALRDKKGEYLGILETSQDITALRDLKGEKRLPE